MSKLRVYEIARKVNAKSSVVIKKLNDMGYKVSSNFSALEEDEASKFIDEWNKSRKEKKARKKAKPPKEEIKEAVEGRREEEKKPPHKRRLKREEFIESVKPQMLKGRKKHRKHDKKRKEEETGESNVIKVSDATTVFEFASKVGVELSDVMSKMFELGVMATKNDIIGFDMASVIAEEYGFEVEREEEESVAEELLDIGDKPEDLKERPPIVTVMGHVDHGKTSILDAIKKTNIADKEAGGITQHIGAYSVRVGGKYITFVDTPGHEAFAEMRARGAQVTDIVVLVVAADDGVMPQTVEAINHAKAAGVAIIVAINKIDKPNAKPEIVKKELSEYGIIPEEWGGNNIFVEVSAKKRLGLDDLLDAVLLTAEVMELKANPNKRAKGVVLEAKLDKQRGPVASVIVKEGTLRIGDPFIVGMHCGKVKAMVNYVGKRIKELPPSFVAEVLGLHGVPEAGDTLIVVKDEQTAREIAKQRQSEAKAVSIRKKTLNLENLFEQIKGGEVKELPIVLKTDVYGSIEAIKSALEKLSTDEVSVNIVHFGVGAVSRSDVNLASASNAIIIGFNVRPTSEASKLASDFKVDIRIYSVIYDIIDDVKKSMAGLLTPEEREEVLGVAEVRDTFHVPKVGTVAGCYVVQGRIARNASVRVIRDNVVIYTGKISSLKRFKEDVTEVQQGYECGVGIDGFNDVRIGDNLEVFMVKKVQREL